MKKSYDIVAEIRTNDSIEITRRLYRNITEIAKKLEEQKSQAVTVIDIFTPSGEVLRSKLRDYCERLIIDDPINHIQKTEELLWRRGFYDVVSVAKKLRKENVWNEMEKAFLSAHLSVGIGFYHHLILRLQLEYDLNLAGVIDFVYLQNQNKKINEEKSFNLLKVPSPEIQKYVTRFIHRSLVCLGDLARYTLDLDPNWDPQIASRYYKIAVLVDNRFGMPHNQLGTIASNKNYGLDAVYHYMRSVLCQEPFEGSEENLKRTIIIHSLNGEEKCLTQRCIARLLLLLQLWDSSSINTDKINKESQILLNDIENCLSTEESQNMDRKPAENEDDIDKYLLYYKNEETTCLTDDMIFKIIVICLMKIIKMQVKGSNEVFGVIAFILAVFSQLLQFIVTRLQKSFSDIPILNKEYELVVVTDTKTEADNANESIKIQETIGNKEVLDEKILKANSNESIYFNSNNKIELNSNHINGRVKKYRDKSKNLLTKLRRPRNRKNSSDSDVSDGEQAIGSSSEDINSDVTENEDVMSDENALSDEVLSEDLTDDEKSNKEAKRQSKPTEQVNGYKTCTALIEKKEYKDDIDTINIENYKDKNDNVTVTKVPDSDKTHENNSTPINAYVTQMEKQKLNPIEILKVLNNEQILVSIKICCDWLQGHQDIIRTCTKGSKSLLKRLIALFNLINLNTESLLRSMEKDLEIFSSLEKVNEAIEIIPLPEDIDLKGLKIFENSHKKIDWNSLTRKKMTKCEETSLRILKIVQFGHYLCSIPESGVKYDLNKDLFNLLNTENNIVKENVSENKNFELDHSKGKLMRHMGKLWLKAEVRALESRLHYKLMSPYLIPDHEAFTKFMPLLKHLVYAKKFIVVIPGVVISALDELKRTSSYAREATRWLESQLQRGSRFLRAQRPHEKLPLPFIKGPKPKDKRAWLYFQIIECCHYLTQQSKSGDTEIPVVTLLTGIDDKKIFTFSPDGLAKSAGVNFEHIRTFHAKWKLSIKSHG